MEMHILQSYRYQLIPSSQQQRRMRRFAGSCRFLFNKALVLQKELYAQGEKLLSDFDLNRKLTQWRNEEETSWLKETPAQISQQALKDLYRAYVNFFAKRADFPRLKKKGQDFSFRYGDCKALKFDQANSRLRLPKLGWIRYRNSREVLGTIKNVTVSYQCGKWYVSIQTEREVEVPQRQGSVIGIDLGITRFATFSDGSFAEPINSFRKHETALRKAQQSMSRKTKFSSNWRKAKAKVQKIHSRIANVRKDFLHKLSTNISKNHAIVCIEDLKVRNMSKSAAGTIEAPGQNVKAKSGLNKSILDQGWFEFRRQLTYKLAWNGGQLIAVPPQNTSRTCPACNGISSENRQSQAKFKCINCGFEEHADLVGAVNILRAGLAQLACQANEITRRQQEPTEVLLAQ